MLLSRNEIHSLFMAIISLFSIKAFADPQRYTRNDPNGDCTTNLLTKLSHSAFTASSVLGENLDFAPQAAKIDALHDSSDTRKAWCPNKLVHNTSNEWLQIEFGSAKFIKNIFTQGRYNGNYGEFVPNYYFDYQRESSETWYRYKDIKLGELITGNHDARNSVYKKFESPLVVNRIRIIPISGKSQIVCLRIGLYGCDFNDDIVEYQIPRGNSMIINSTEVSFDDSSYDGIKFSNQTWLKGGIGKLMDNNILSNTTPISQLPTYVIAWNKNQQNSDFVTLLFRFHQVRKFRSVKIYNTEEPSISFDIFKSIIIDFLKEEQGSKISSIHVSDIKVGKYQPVIINLKNYFCKFVRIKLFFNKDWIALNEIVFLSDIQSDVSPIITTPSLNDNPSHITLEISTTHKDTILFASSNLVYYIVLIICVIGSVILTGVGFFLCFLWMKQRQRRRYKNKFFDQRSILFNDPYHNTCGLRTISGNNPLIYRPLTPHSYVPTITNNTQNMGFRFVHSQFPPCPDYCPPPINNCNDYEAIDSYWPKSLSQSISFNEKKLDQHDRQTLLTTAAPDITCINKSGAVYCSGSTYSSNIYSQPENEINFPVPDILPVPDVTQDTLNGMFKMHLNNPLKGPLGSTISNFQLPPVSESWIELSLARIPEIPSNQIHLKSLIAEGEIAAFMTGYIENRDVEILAVRYKPNNLRTDSKSLFYRQCCAKLKEDFSSHPNFLPIIGHCLTGWVADKNIPVIVFAYPSQINIVTFFKKLHLLPRTNEISFTCSCVSQSSLLYLAKQLAGALSYLRDIGVVHKDVSARNCSVGENFHLFLGDFAIGIEEFKDDYISIKTPSYNNDINQQPAVVQLPLLWMPWEAIIMGNYSTKSDIWSFGVTIWEIFTECQMKPYSSFCNQNQDRIASSIIRNAMLIAHNHPSSILPNNRSMDLAQAAHENSNQADSSKQVRDIMADCWKSDPASRPSFQKLYSLLCNLIPTTRPMDEYSALYQMIV